jgi:hypothetical protein
MSKNAEVSQYRTEVGEFQIKLAKAHHRNDTLKDEKDAEINRIKNDLESKEFEYTRIRQSLILRDTQIKELQTLKDQSRHKILLLEEEIDRVKNENKYLINDLQHRNG